jgi:ribosomal protein S18 acetylase RimI-like enzyme
MALAIRKAEERDLAGIAKLHTAVNRELAGLVHEGCTGTILDEQVADEVLAEFTERLEDESCLVYVAEHVDAPRGGAKGDGGLAGFLTAALEEYSDELIGAPFITIEFVETAPSARGQGVATALIKAVEQAAREQGVTYIDLLVWESNTSAARLYEELGYSTLERRLMKHI